MSKRIIVDIPKLQHAIHGGFPITISSYTLPHSVEAYIADVLSAVLKELNMSDVFDYLSYSLSELIVNAKKANTKRIYFQDLGLDIHKPEEYEQGMANFKTDTLKDIDRYLQMQKTAGLYIKTIFQVINKNLVIEIRNNSEMLMCEYVRIHDKLVRSRQFDRDDKAQIAQLVDDSEGAGLGLILIMQMFHKIGMGEDNYEIIVANGETITRLTVPLDQEVGKNMQILSNAISSYVSNLAPFPENIMRLQTLLNDPDAKISDIAHFISTDVGLTADLLRFVNSASFALGKQCQNISEAIKFVGFRTLKDMLYSYGSQKVLGATTDVQRDLWAHCYRVGYYAYNLARQFSKQKSLLEDVYTCGILHDMGKIVFYNSYPDFDTQVTDICSKNNIPPQLLESIVGGSNHAEIGALVAEKWNFPDKLSAAIRFHHAPLSAPTAVREMVEYVYIANCMVNLISDSLDFYQVNPEVLDVISVTEEQQFRDIAEQLEKGYQASVAQQS